MTVDRFAEIDYADYEVTENDIQWLVAEIKRLRYKNAQYIAMLKIAAPAALAICDADISHDRG